MFTLKEDIGYIDEIEFVKENNYVEKSSAEIDSIENIDIRKCKFATYGGDFLVRQLVDMMSEGEIEIPKIQRNYVWTLKIASRFIESILLDLPIPSLFFAKSADGKFIIIDGLQRLTCLYNYIVSGVMNGKTFKLSLSKDIHSEWRGKSFNELGPEDKRKLKNKLLHTIIVEQKVPTNFDGLFLIFERINTGGMQLNQQEIRNSLFQCPMNNLMLEINDYDTWRRMFGQDTPNARMRDVEMILRFFTLNELDLFSDDLESMNLVTRMNDFMTAHRKDNEEILYQYKKMFCDTVDTVFEAFGENIFRTNIQNMKVSQKFYATVFDAIMLATTIAKKANIPLNNLKNITNKTKLLFEDETFREACNAHTTDASSIRQRISKACEILYGIQYEN